ncbi:Esterase E4, partial [Orchesella cincta]
ILTTQFVLPTVLGPVIDKYSRPPSYQFLPDYPEKLPIVNRVPVIAGITKDEGLTAFVFLSQEFSVKELNNLEYIQKVILPKYLNLIMRSRGGDSLYRAKFIQSLSSQVMAFYMQDFLQDPVSTLVGILGDIWINTCHRKTMESFCFNDVPAAYAYLFTHHDPVISPSEIGAKIEELREAGMDHPIFDYGVAHTEEILYMLLDNTPEGIRKLHLTRNRVMSEILSKIWTSFANDMSPEVTTLELPYVSWPQWNPVCRGHNYTDPDFSLYEISLNNHRLFKNYRVTETQFWWKIHQDTFS